MESGFSVNKELIRKTKTCLTIGSINGLRLCKDVVHQYGKPESVPLGKEIISTVATARVTYEKRLEEERLQKKKEEPGKENKKERRRKCEKCSTCENRTVSLKKKKLNFKRKKKCTSKNMK